MLPASKAVSACSTYNRPSLGNPHSAQKTLLLLPTTDSPGGLNHAIPELHSGKLGGSERTALNRTQR